MTSNEAITLLRNLEESLDSYCELNEKGKTAFRMAIEALSCSEFPNSLDCISRQAAIDALDKRFDDVPMELTTEILQLRRDLRGLPSAQPEIAENLYLYKCYITDKDGLQHEVIHTGDIRRVTGWEI